MVRGRSRFRLPPAAPFYFNALAYFSRRFRGCSLCATAHGGTLLRDLDHIVLRYHLTAAIADRFWSKVDKSGGPDACWPWTASCRGNGYGRFKIEPRVSVATNRLAWALHNQKDPGPMLVCHSCDNPPCCNPGHLWLGTVRDNNADKIEKGRGRTGPQDGEQNGAAKLSALQVETIKAMIRAGKNNKEIAKPFGVTHQLISRIRRGKAWGDQPMQERYAHLKKRA